MKIILTEEQLKKISKSVSLSETRKPTRQQLLFAKSSARAIQNKFYGDYLVISKLFYKFSQFADNIHGKLYNSYNTWDDDNLKRKMAVIYNQLKEKLEDFGNEYLVNDDKFNELNSQMMDYIKEQIDTEDEENELMKSWYGDDSFDEYGALGGEDEEDNEEVELDFNYAPEYDVDSDDSYDLSRENDLTNRMRRSVRVGAAGAVDRDTKRYVIDGKGYSLTPVEYRQMLKDMGRITPEKATNMGIDVDTSGVIRKNSDETHKKIKYLEKRIKSLQNGVERLESQIDPYRKNNNLDWSIKYTKAALETAMDEYDELTGNVDGEEYNF
jgi:molecular chaperone GrpE (heat shock protein)